MRNLIGILTVVFAVSGAASPKQGIQTPGVQIPFSSLKAEATFQTPDQPDWIFFSTDIFVPAKDRLDKIDVKTNKIADPVAGLNKPCGGMVSAFGSLWIPACGDGSLVQGSAMARLHRGEAPGRSTRRHPVRLLVAGCALGALHWARSSAPPAACRPGPRPHRSMSSRKNRC